MKGCCLGVVGGFLFLAAVGALVVGLVGWAFWSGASQAWRESTPAAPATVATKGVTK